jgi:RNA polymerase sigma-70 factor (ECF subfamily)
MAKWLQEARQGSKEALGQLLDSCRQYLLLVANQGLYAPLQAKVGPSDLVQDTFLKAHRQFETFAGTTEAELLAWLRRILLNNVANATRSFLGTAGRDLDREVEEKSGSERMAAAGDTPSARLVGQEQDEALERAIDKLPENYRQVIRWQLDEGLSYEEMGRRLGRSPEAVRKLSNRAVERLAKILEPPDERR